MSISSPQTGGNRRPSTKPAAGAKPGTKSTGAKPGAKATGKAEPAAKAGPTAKTSTAKTSSAAKTSPTAKAGGGKSGGRPPIAPVKVNTGRPWGAILLFGVVIALAVSIVGFGVYELTKSDETWKDKANSIPGIVNFYQSNPDLVKSGQHQFGTIKYQQSPPVAGPHNPNWQRCMGDVYPDPIASEHAVHALEHGAVWITYRPDLPKDQVEKLAGKVRGNDFMLMSPYPGLDKPISLQAWGYQLKVDSANDSRIDDFIRDLRQNATQEAGVVCSSGNDITTTGTTPHDLGSPAPSPAG
jgi:hypothetical protein